MTELKEYVVYDVEVRLSPDVVAGGWNNPEGMGFASAVAYDYAVDKYFFFLHEEGKCELIGRLKDRIAVTFNGIQFDSRVVLGNDRMVDLTGITRKNGTGWENCDVLIEYIRSRFEERDIGTALNRLKDRSIHDRTFNLDGLAEGTFGLHKSGHGPHAPHLYQKGLFAELLDYNLHDVRLTRKLFEFAKKYTFVRDRAGRSVVLEI